MRLVLKQDPYRFKNVAEKTSLTRVLSRDYPIVKVGNSADGKVAIASGVTTTFRSIVKGKKPHLDSTELKEIYKKWEQHPLLNRKY